MTAILETAIYAEDLDAAEQFYGSVLGFEKITRAGNRHVFYRLAGSVLLIFNPKETIVPPQEGALAVPPHGAVGQGHLCFVAAVEEQTKWAEKLSRAGIEPEAKVTWPNDCQSLYFRDPAGNSVEFAEKQLWFDQE